MTPLSGLKRRLVREVVRENLDTIHGRPRPPIRRRHRARRVGRRGVQLVLLFALLLVSISALAISGGGHGDGPRDTPSVSGDMPSRSSFPAPPPFDPAAGHGDALLDTAPVAGLTPPTSFPAPRPVDPAAFPLAVGKIVLDPGHGGKDPGAPTPFGRGEKDATLDVARRLRELLWDAGFEVVMTREGDQTVSLRERAQLANGERGDLFVSIHFNSLPSRRYRGVETYYLGPTDDPEVERLVSAENSASGYSYADFRSLLEGVFTHARRKESRAFAELMHRRLVASLRQANPHLRDNGIKAAPFLVLVATEMPGVLAEVSVLSNREEALLVSNPDYRHKIAWALFEGVRAYADARNRPGPRAGGS